MSVAQANALLDDGGHDLPRAVRPLRRDPLFISGAVILVLIVAASLAAPLLSSHDPNTIDLLQLEAAPSSAHVLGTDALGRDVLARLLYGGRI